MKSREMQRVAPERLAAAGHVKGVAMIEFARWATARHRARVETAVERMPATLAAQLEPQSPTLGFIATDWYSAELINAFFEAMLQGQPWSARSEFFAEATRAFTRQTMNGVHKGLAQILESPERYAHHAQRIWSSYYDSGVYTVDVLGEHAACCRVERWRSHQPLMCLWIWGAVAAIFESMGLRGVDVQRQSCVSEGASACEFAVTWEE
jgi:hypothetical protein